MTSIINKLGLIALLVTSAVAFEVSAQETQPQAAQSKQQLPSDTQKQVDTLLDGLHSAATNADWAVYFNAYHQDAVFLGTDASERWSMEEFKRYANASKGWHYEVKKRSVIQIDDVIVFDEQLHSPAYGKSRGTGALVLTPKGWKIAQYHLSFPIPNDKAKEITQLIAK
jgi:hypothetical protein